MWKYGSLVCFFETFDFSEVRTTCSTVTLPGGSAHAKWCELSNVYILVSISDISARFPILSA